MRSIWSEFAKRRAWRRVWVCVAEAQTAAGLITAEQMDDISSHEEDIDLKRASEIEDEIGHDLVAELRTRKQLWHSFSIVYVVFYLFLPIELKKRTNFLCWVTPICNQQNRRHLDTGLQVMRRTS
jgi:hypothetical protein